MKHKIICLLLFASLLVSSQAEAVKVRGRNISTISDIVRAAGGVASANDKNIQLPKNSYFRVADFGQELELTYDIGHSNTEKSLGTISGFQSTNNGYDLGLVAAVSKTTFGNQKVVISSTRTQFWCNSAYRRSNWFYYLYFLKVGRDEDGNISQSRFAMWHYPREYGRTTSGFIKDIKAGISVEGFDGELVIAATMETTNDNTGKAVKFSDKKANVRFDFWALYTKDGEVQYRKIDEITKLSGYLETAPLLRMENATDDNWASKNTLDNTVMSPYMVVKVEPIDLDGDGYTNEIAMLTAYVNGIDLDFYRISYDNGKFSITGSLPGSGRQYTYSNPDYVRKWSYNGWNRVPGADIVAGNFDSDAQTEIAVIFQGDFPASERDGSGDDTLGFYGGMVKTLQTKVFKWDNEHGRFNSKDSVRQDYSYSKEEFWAEGYIKTYQQGVMVPVPAKGQYGYEKKLDMSFGGLKAAAADIDGDGTDEVVIAGYRGHTTCHVEWHIKFQLRGEAGEDNKYYNYEVYPYILLLKASDGALKFDGSVTLASKSVNAEKLYSRSTRSFTGDTHNGNGEVIMDTKYPFDFQNYDLAPVGKNEYLYPVVDREISIAAGPMFGTQGKSKLCDDVVVRVRTYLGGRIRLFKSNGSGLRLGRTFSAQHTAAIVTADFVGEGVALGSPTHIIKDDDVSYMMVLQGAPYHVDNISEDGKTLITTPINYSYHKDMETTYEKISSSSEGSQTNFDIHNSVETIFALDQDAANNIIGGNDKIKMMSGLVKTFAGFILKVGKAVDYVDKFTSFIDSCTDKVDHIKQGFDKETKNVTDMHRLSTHRSDAIEYVSAP